MLEDLLSIQEEGIPALVTEKVTRLNWKLAKTDKPDHGGVYVFWWRHSIENFLERIQNPILHFSGPNGRQLSHTINSESLSLAENKRLPLYVGKASSSIAERAGLHLTLGTMRTVAADQVNGIARRKTTSCQVRDRLDRLFPLLKDTRILAIENLSLSYTKLDGENNFAERFFLEDLAIGILRPPFNIDSER